MDDSRIERAIKLAGFLIAGALLFESGLTLLAAGLENYIFECIGSSFSGSCPVSEGWYLATSATIGAVLVTMAIVFFVLAFKNRSPPRTWPPAPAPNPP